MASHYQQQNNQQIEAVAAVNMPTKGGGGDLWWDGGLAVEAVLVHDPVGALALGGAAGVEDEGLLHADGGGAVADLPVLAGGLPPPAVARLVRARLACLRSRRLKKYHWESRLRRRERAGRSHGSTLYRSTSAMASTLSGRPWTFRFR
uniref:Uncharacterized protein n=1 Tax=Oryza nivara TaxID=4536 RepID=A0A0E0IFV7_ORYNI